VTSRSVKAGFWTLTSYSDRGLCGHGRTSGVSSLAGTGLLDAPLAVAVWVELSWPRLRRGDATMLFVLNGADLCSVDRFCALFK